MNEQTTVRGSRGAPLPTNERQRIAALEAYGILDTPEEAIFEGLTQLASQICGTPISTLTLIDADRQWFKSARGVEVRETDRASALCAYTILEPDLLVVPDATADERFASNRFVLGDPSIRFYAGVPLRTADGYALGSLCVIDMTPRQLSSDQLDALRTLGRAAMAHLELRRDRLDAARRAEEERVRSRAENARLEERLAAELRQREVVATELARLTGGDSPERTAARICASLLAMPGIDVVAVFEVIGSETIRPLAFDGKIDASHVPLDVMSDIAAFLIRRATLGPWIDEARNGPTGPLMRSLGLQEAAYSPLRSDGEVVGLLVAGSTSTAEERQLTRPLAAVSEFGAMAAALIGPMLLGRRKAAAVRAAVERVIAQHEYSSVFQPVFSVVTGKAEGYEALTRFIDGTRPDIRFAAATAAGMGTELELATLTSAIEAARSLPPGHLGVNVSARVLEGCGAISGLIRGAGRPIILEPIILEVTEHEAVADYERLREAIQRLPAGTQLAVDDAGSGFASLQHVVELRPDLVKLDISLVRNVDRDVARRAAVAGFAHFAREIGCELVAEGIETRGELQALRELGVQYAQGFLLGRPAEAATFKRRGDRRMARRLLDPVLSAAAGL